MASRRKSAFLIGRPHVMVCCLTWFVDSMIPRPSICLLDSAKIVNTCHCKVDATQQRWLRDSQFFQYHLGAICSTTVVKIHTNCAIYTDLASPPLGSAHDLFISSHSPHHATIPPPLKKARSYEFVVKSQVNHPPFSPQPQTTKDVDLY